MGRFGRARVGVPPAEQNEILGAPIIKYVHEMFIFGGLGDSAPRTISFLRQGLEKIGGSAPKARVRGQNNEISGGPGPPARLEMARK